MQAFRKHRGLAAPLDRADVDTDAIIPKQFLKRVERTGFGQFLFFDWRFKDDGSEAPEFVLNRPEYRNATVLLARRNFGCGSSREHAPWSLADYGFRVLIAPSFADIFYNNCFKNGILPVSLPESVVDELFQRAKGPKPLLLTADLETCQLRDDEDWEIGFEVAPFRRECMLNGWDDIGMTLRKEGAIADYERRLAAS